MARSHKELFRAGPTPNLLKEIAQAARDLSLWDAMETLLICQKGSESGAAYLTSGARERVLLAHASSEIIARR